MSAPAPRAEWRSAYDAQMALWRWESSQQGQFWLMHRFGEHITDWVGDGLAAQELLHTLYSTEPTRLHGADPIFVSREMCEVVASAMQTFQPEPLLPSDFITPYGFMWFAKPFPVLDRFDDPTNIVAAAWTPLLSTADGVISTDEDGLVYSHGGDRRAEERWRAGHSNEGVVLTIYASAKPSDWDRWPIKPSCLPMHMTPWYFNMTLDGEEWDVHGKPTGARWWWTVVQTSLRLMQQRITVRHTERPDKGQRRDGDRSGFGADRDIVVVRLRRERENHEPSGESAHYSHRFIVGGHWKPQWYPSAQVHRQIYIQDYIKGPEDAELRIKPRRYVWDR